MSSNLKLESPYNPLAKSSDVFHTQYNNMLENMSIIWGISQCIQVHVYKRLLHCIYRYLLTTVSERICYVIIMMLVYQTTNSIVSNFVFSRISKHIKLILSYFTYTIYTILYTIYALYR